MCVACKAAGHTLVDDDADTKDFSPDATVPITSQELDSDAPPANHERVEAQQVETVESSGRESFDRYGGSVGDSAAGSQAPTRLLVQFEIKQELARGGMGVVYRAWDDVFQRNVAIKVLQENHAAGGTTAERFMDEARITGQLQHPGIPPVHQVGTLPDGRPFLAMKLIEGRTLGDLLNARKSPEEDRGRFIAIFEQIAQAVAYAHSLGVIHRDLKPSNVMVGAFGEVQVMDWGLAKVISGAAARSTPNDEPRSYSAQPALAEPVETAEVTVDYISSRTVAGQVMGTPAYMPPEQARGDVDQVGTRADVFSLGGILCTILTGQPPYTGRSSAQALRTASAGQLREAMNRLENCEGDPELVSLWKQCLSIDRTERPADAGVVADAVTAHLAAAEERARRLELDRVRAAERQKRRRMQLSLIASVVGLIAVVLAGIALASLWRSAEEARETEESARNEAQREKLRADDARQAADAAYQSAEMERRKLAVFEYGRTIQVAYDAWRDGNIPAALVMLNSTREDLRGWEWHYVHRLCHSELLTLRGHSENVVFASFSPDGSRIITTSYDKSAKVWDARTGAELFELVGHENSVTHAAFSPDGSKVVTASWDHKAKVWDAKTGVLIHTLEGHLFTVSSASFSPDSSRIVTASTDRTAKVWDTKTGIAMFTIEGHDHHVYAATFSADGSRIVTGSTDKTARIWDAESGKMQLILKGHTDEVRSAMFNHDGSRIVTGSLDKTAKLWDTKTGTEIRDFRGHSDRVHGASFSPDGARVVTCSDDMSAIVWDVNTGNILWAIK